MKQVIVADKQTYFYKNYPFENAPALTDKRRCIHCDEIITVGDFKVFKNEEGFEFISCPNAPVCDGTIIDWITIS